MSKFRANTSFYADGGKHFNQNEEVDAGVYYSLTATDKGKFTEVPDAAPAVPVAPLSQPAGPLGAPSEVLNKMEADLDQGGSQPVGPDAAAQATPQGLQEHQAVPIAADTQDQINQLLSHHHETLGQKMSDFIKEVEVEGEKLLEKIREVFTGKKPVQQ